ncbi:MAG: hypothetical protein EBZ75_12510 [Oxalobacteraceae bacterium]|nr:hypothetical protein [Oxalobacteraceae bacterium]
MAPTDAVQLDNYFPGVSNVVLRGGYVKHATGFPDDVETLMTYSGGTSDQLWAVSDGKFYNATAAGAIGAAAVSGLTNSKWEYTNVTTAGGNYLYAANGVNTPYLYNGTNWTSITGVSTPAITGVTTTNLNSPTLFKNRVWFIQKDTLKAWYLPTSSVGGAAQVLDLSSIARLGGVLVSMASWTIDAGYGVDDNLVFVTDKGEVIVYRGTDPSSASTWALIGVWIVGAPIGTRSLMKYGGDLLVLTLDGLIPMASALQSSRLDPNIALSDKIQGAFATAAAAYKDNFGWCMLYNPKNNALIVNVPVREGAQEQFVMNNITKAWCRFTNWNAFHFGLLDDTPYFGAANFVAKAWTVGSTGYIDDTSNINGKILQAFNYFETRGVKKIFTRARPSIFSNGTPSVRVGINVDFNISDNVAPISFSTPLTALWDSALWNTAVWGSDLEIQNNWQGVTGVGYCGSIQFQSSSNKLAIQWASTDVVYQLGWAGI